MELATRLIWYCCFQAGSCGIRPFGVQSGVPASLGGGSQPPKYVLVRVASVEHQFTDSAECRRQATLYYNNTGKPGAPPQPLPNVYRWEGTTSTEVRFVVVPAEPDQPAVTDHILNYWELDKPSKIRDVFEDLASQNHWRKKLPPAPDPAALLVNGHLTERAILEIPLATGGAKSVSTAASSLFGIIINPPYP